MKLASLRIRLFDTASPLDNLARYCRYHLSRRPQQPGFQWSRTVMYDHLVTELRQLGLQNLHALEISAGDFWQRLGFKSYRSIGYPSFDICDQKLQESFDIIIADQVFEHLLWPYRAARNVYGMLKPGGRFVVTTPFLIRIHDDPVDCSRWTELGIKHLLAEAGFDLAKIRTFSWGNKSCVKANLKHTGWAVMKSWSSLKNDPAYPVVIWAIAEK